MKRDLRCLWASAAAAARPWAPLARLARRAWRALTGTVAELGVAGEARVEEEWHRFQASQAAAGAGRLVVLALALLALYVTGKVQGIPAPYPFDLFLTTQASELAPWTYAVSGLAWVLLVRLLGATLQAQDTWSMRLSVSVQVAIMVAFQLTTCFLVAWVSLPKAFDRTSFYLLRQSIFLMFLPLYGYLPRRYFLCLGLPLVALPYVVLRFLGVPLSVVFRNHFFMMLVAVGFFFASEQRGWALYRKISEVEGEREFLEATQVVYMGLLNSLFDASCVCDELGVILSSSPHMEQLLLGTQGIDGSSGLVASCLPNYAAEQHEAERWHRFLAEAAKASTANRLHTSLRCAGGVANCTVSCIALPGGAGKGFAKPLATSNQCLFIGLQLEVTAVHGDPLAVAMATAAAADAEPSTGKNVASPAFGCAAELFPGPWTPFSNRSSEQHAALPTRDSDRSLGNSSFTLVSAMGFAQQIPFSVVSLDSFVERFVLAAPAEISETLRHVAALVMQAPGGCAFAVASREAFKAVQQGCCVDFQCVDRDHRWHDGYMTAKLKGLHVSDRAFGLAVQDFVRHEASDRWPEGHEASGLPKDGFAALLDASGYRLKAAVRAAGLPLAPFQWGQVGTRHMAALSLAWTLRFSASAVLVRSDSSCLHGLLFSTTACIALACEGAQPLAAAAPAAAPEPAAPEAEDLQHRRHGA